jgi:Ca2+-binding EF-hand superfamily protein
MVATRGAALTCPTGLALSVLDYTTLGDNVKLSREEERRLKEVFVECDYDRSGQVAKSEVRDLLANLKWRVDQNQLDDFINTVFGDNTTVLDLDMFMRIFKGFLVKQPTSVRKQQSAKDGTKNGATTRISINDLRLLETDLRSLFNEMDESRTGYLSIEEMRQVMRSSGLPDPDGDNFETAVQEHMRIADVNNDGQVSFEEFIGYRNQMIQYVYDMFKEESGAAGVEEDPQASKQFRFTS